MRFFEKRVGAGEDERCNDAAFSWQLAVSWMLARILQNIQTRAAPKPTTTASNNSAYTGAVSIQTPMVQCERVPGSGIK